MRQSFTFRKTESERAALLMWPVRGTNSLRMLVQLLTEGRLDDFIIMPS